MDLGCTRSMGSRRAVLAFEIAARSKGIFCEWNRCWTRMSFANSESAWLEWCVTVWFPTEPPVCTTIDVHDQGDIPILMSLPQMMNLGMDLQLRPNAIHLTCKTLGYHNELLPFSISRHVILDLSRVKGKISMSEMNSGKGSPVSFSCEEASTIASETSALELNEGYSYPARRRLDSKTSSNSERPADGVPSPKPKAKAKVKPKKVVIIKVKEKGDPDELIELAPVGRPEPQDDGA